MPDVVVTVPKRLWAEWLAEGCLPGETMDEDLVSGYNFFIGDRLPQIEPGERVYIVAHGRLRGYAPLLFMDDWHGPETGWRTRQCLVRGDEAVAVTIPKPIQGFRGFRYRWWDRADEVPFPDWQTEGVE